MKLLSTILNSKRFARFRSPTAGLALLLTIASLSPTRALGQPVLESLLHTFSNNQDGGIPQAGVTLGANGALYGTTSTGGSALSYGVAFKVNIDGSGYTVLHNFTNTPDSAVPQGALIFGTDGVLYGTASGGGASGAGTIFKMHVDGNGYQILHSFTGAPDGGGPVGGLMQATNGTLYGTTQSGGTANLGAIFSIDTNGGYQVLYSFTGNPDGSAPQETLLQGSDGALYGSANSGGASGKGVIFKIQLNGGGYQLLHTFTNNPDGSNPHGTLLQASDGAMYGVTSTGGAANQGIIYKMNLNGTGYTVLHDFTSGLDGRVPSSGLVQGVNNTLYGVTPLGGTNGTGTGVFYRMQVGGGGYAVVYYFGRDGDGTRPTGGLTRGASIGDMGVLYGTTANGPSGSLGGLGTVFAMVVAPSLNITPLVSQNSTNGPIVFWPAFAYNYVLQTTTNLGSGPWVNVTNGIPFTGMLITNLPDPANAYFRLIWPQ